MLPVGSPRALAVLGPILFLIYINSVVSDLQAKCCHFADDLKLYLALPLDKSDCVAVQHVLQSDINLLYHRSGSWSLTFSSHKCSRMRFSRGYGIHQDLISYYIGNDFIPDVISKRDLGVSLSSSCPIYYTQS